jgi:hypothetical protein
LGPVKNPFLRPPVPATSGKPPAHRHILLLLVRRGSSGAGFWRALRKDSPTSFFGLAESIGEKASGSVEIDMTNEELASLANITPYTVCSMISNWQRDGLIRKKRATVLIRSP